MADEIVVRGSELAAVEAFLDRGAGGLAALVFEGEAGIGKSTVWEAGRRGRRISRVARPDVAAGAVRAGADARRADRPLRRTSATRRSVGSPLRNARRSESRSCGSSQAARRRTSARCRSRSRGCCASSPPDRPVLIAIDDAQWLDESTAAILAYALRRLADQPVGLLATVRTGAETPASDGLLAAVPADRLERVELGPMHLAALHRLFQVRLGRSFPRLVLVRIEEASGGNPLYALELGRALLRDGIPADAHGTLPVPDSLGSLIAGRVSRLPEPTRRAMLLAAAAAEPTVATLERASPGIEADLRPAVEDQLVVIERWRRPVRATRCSPSRCSSLAPAAELRAAHEALAGATQSQDARARHLAHAADGPDESVAATLDRGRRARPEPRRDARRREPLPGGEPPDARRTIRWPRSTEPASPPSACSSTCPSISRPTGSSRRRSIGPRRPRARRRAQPARDHPLLPRARAPRRSSWASRRSRRRATTPGSARRCSGGSGTS